MSDLRAEIDAFVRAERARSLWWLREGWMPEDDAGRLWLLDQVERRADRETFALARRLRRAAPAGTPAPGVARLVRHRALEESAVGSGDRW